MSSVVQVPYQTVHTWLPKELGRADEYACVDCGGRARDWTYDHVTEPKLVEETTGRKYTTALEGYQPRCRSCHMLWDGKRWCEEHEEEYVEYSHGHWRCRSCRRESQRAYLERQSNR